MKKQHLYYIAPNGMKIEITDTMTTSLKVSFSVAEYCADKIRSDISEAVQVPKDMLFPEKK